MKVVQCTIFHNRIERCTKSALTLKSVELKKKNTQNMYLVRKPEKKNQRFQFHPTQHTTISFELLYTL